MSAFAARVLLLVQHFSAILTTFGDKAVPIATVALKWIDQAEKLFPSITKYVQPVQVALTMLVQYGPELAADLDKFEAAFKLIGSVESLTPKLDAIVDTPTLTSAVSQ